MVERHAEEVPSGMPLAIDWPQYQRSERAGVYRLIGAFAGGRLVGYSGFFVQPTMQHRTTVQALNDVLYLDPACRGRDGVRLITEAEPLLKSLGAQRIVYASHPGLPHGRTNARVAELLTRLGYAHVESTHSKQV